MDEQPWLPKWIEDEPGKSKLKNFKKRVQTDHNVAFFTNRRRSDVDAHIVRLDRFAATKPCN